MNPKSAIRVLFLFVAVVIAIVVVPLIVSALLEGSAGHHRGLPACVNTLRQIEGAKEEYALEYGVTNGTQMTWDDFAPYIKDITNKVFCPSAPATMRSLTNYTINPLGVNPECNVVGAKGGHSLRD